MKAWTGTGKIVEGDTVPGKGAETDLQRVLGWKLRQSVGTYVRDF